MKKIYILITILFISVRIISPVAILAVDRPDIADRPDIIQDAEDEVTPESESPESPTEPDNTDNNVQSAEEASMDQEDATPVTEELNGGEQEQTAGIQSTDNQDSSSEGFSGETSNQVGDTKIDTGDSDIVAGINNTGNTNILNDANVLYNDAGDSVVLKNSENGTGSINDASANIIESDDSVQINDAELDNSLVASSETGSNIASKNVGSSEIETGDANVTGTIINNVNTNMAGVMMSEFNVVDDQLGDLVLDFENNCTFGCSSGGTEITNQGNGSDSSNTGELSVIDEGLTFQSNSGTLENEMILTADSGNNEANNNVSGNNTIETGDANVAANILNFMNNNIAGNVFYGVVNIFGDLVGNIILPQSEIDKYAANTTLANSGNGSSSTNDAIANLSESDNYMQFNDAEIINNVGLDATTGDNEASDNTGGNTKIDTGDSDINATITNIANNNIIGDNWWIVFVNESGNWTGKIINPLGMIVGDFIGASGGTEITNPGTGIYNANNGSESENLAELNKTSIQETVQLNEANIVNNVDLSANTGNNSTSRNTNGNNSITTGDANIELNILNFVNNNIIGGNVFVTFVNVFGSWMGDFIAPGATAEASNTDNNNEKALGGAGNTPTNNSTNQSSSNSSNGGSSSNESNTSNNSNPVLASVTNNQQSAISSLNWTGSSETEEDLSQEETDPSKVLGISTEATDKNKIRINFAWVMLTLPVGLVIYRFGLISKLTSLLLKR